MTFHLGFTLFMIQAFGKSDLGKFDGTCYPFFGEGDSADCVEGGSWEREGVSSDAQGGLQAGQKQRV